MSKAFLHWDGVLHNHVTTVSSHGKSEVHVTVKGERVSGILKTCRFGHSTERCDYVFMLEEASFRVDSFNSYQRRVAIAITLSGIEEPGSICLSQAFYVSSGTCSTL